MSGQTSIAVAGAGLIGRAHIARIQAQPGARLGAIVDPSPAARDMAAGLGVPYFADVAEALATARPDGLVIATPNAFHVPHGLAAVEAGVPMLLEKPPANDVESARTLVEAAERKGVPILVGHHHRHSPLMRRAREVIQSGRWAAHRGQRNVPLQEAGPWLLRWCRLLATRAGRRRGAHQPHPRRRRPADPVRRRGRGAGDELQRGPRLSGGGQRRGPPALRQRRPRHARSSDRPRRRGAGSDLRENKAYPQTDQSCYLVAGTRGSLAVPRLETWTHDGDGWWTPIRSERITAPEEDPLTLQMKHFLAVVRGEATPVIDGREGMRTLATTLAVKAAAAGSGAWSRLERDRNCGGLLPGGLSSGCSLAGALYSARALGRRNAMGLFKFIKDAGAKLFGGKAQAATSETITEQVKGTGLDTSSVALHVDGDTVKLTGKAMTQEEAERLILAAGNTIGVATVDTSELIITKETPPAEFYTVKKGDAVGHRRASLRQGTWPALHRDRRGQLAAGEGPGPDHAGWSCAFRQGLTSRRPARAGPPPADEECACILSAG